MIKNKVTYVIGNILDATDEILVHQGNAQGAMGGGLAGQLTRKYPKLRASFKRWSSVFPSPEERMGKVHIFHAPDGKDILTIVGQMYYGRENKVYTDYDSLTEGLIEVGRIMKRMRKTIAIPYKIGCGLAGGDWNVVKQRIESWETVTNDFTTVYKLKDE